MTHSRTLSTLVLAFAALGASAQTTGDHAAHHPAQGASAPAPAAERMAGMDAHMKAMQAMHDKMATARTPEERQALMAEHMKLMQDGMAMMGGMGPGMGMGGMPGGRGKPGMPGGAMTPQMRQQMMEKRMDMMQSMMQMMMDRMQAMPPASK
jgi:hypothetical protein